MPENMFSKVWDLIVSRFPDSYPHQSLPGKNTAEEVYEAMYRIAPTLAQNIPIAASWVVRVVREGPGALTDMERIKALAQTELFLKACELISVLTNKENAELDTSSQLPRRT